MQLKSWYINNNIMDIDLQIYCCKFYDEDINVKHSYFLFIPGKKDTTTFRINFDQTAQPNEETESLENSAVVSTLYHQKVSHASTSR